MPVTSAKGPKGRSSNAHSSPNRQPLYPPPRLFSAFAAAVENSYLAAARTLWNGVEALQDAVADRYLQARLREARKLACRAVECAAAVQAGNAETRPACRAAKPDLQAAPAVTRSTRGMQPARGGNRRPRKLQAA